MIIHQISSKEGVAIQVKKVIGYLGEKPIEHAEISMEKQTANLTKVELLELIDVLNFILKS